MQFDQARGYGFVAADDGGEDVFLHASVFDGDPEELIPGTKLEFKVMAGDRGRKAFAVRVIDEDPAPASEPGLAQPPRSLPSAPPAEPAQPLPPAQNIPPRRLDADAAPDSGPLCDVLSSVDFGQELAELLLSNVPGLTGHQIVEIRQTVLEYAMKHGWVIRAA
jgi:cold shock protein